MPTGKGLGLDTTGTAYPVYIPDSLPEDGLLTQIRVQAVSLGETLDDVDSRLDNLQAAGLPDQTGHSGEFLTTDGSQASWGDPATGGMTNPMTNLGDIIIGGTAGAPDRFGAGTGWLHNNGSGTFAWSTPSKSDVGLGNVTNDAQLKIASNLSDLNNTATARTNLGVAIGTNVQAWDGDLDAIAALAGTSGLLKKTAANTWTLRTVLEEIGFTPENVANKATDFTTLNHTLYPTTQAVSTFITTGFQPLDTDLTEIAAVANVRGDLLVTNSGPTWVRLAVGGASTLLKSDGTDPSWGTVNVLSAFHADTTAGTVTRGDVITGQGATPKWTRLAISVPAANVLNVFGVANGDTEPAWKTVLDATDPVTLTVSTTPAPGTSLVFAHRDHAHQITSSSDPGENAFLLASNAAGQLTLVDLLAHTTTFNLINATATTVNFAGAATALSIGSAVSGYTTISSPTINLNGSTIGSTSTSVNLFNASSTTINFAGAATTLSVGAVSGTTTMQSGTVSLSGTLLSVGTGYVTDIGQLSKKFRSIYAAELVVETLVAQDTMATMGGRLLIGPTTQLIEDINGSATTFKVKHNNLANGDRVYMQAGGYFEAMAIASDPTPVTGGYSYTITRDLDGTGGNSWAAGDAVFNTGSAGSGFWDLFSLNSTITQPLNYIYNFNATGSVYSSNYNITSNWSPFGDGANTEVNDAIYFGLSNSTWANLYFNLSTAASYTGTLVWEFWNNSAWTSFTPTFVGNTNGDFKQAVWQGFEWTAGNLTSWTANSVNGQTAYWVRVRISAFTSWATLPVASRRVYYNKGQIGPTQVLWKRNSSTWSDVSEHAAFGELAGFYGYGASTIGVALGPYGAGKTYITLDATNGLRMYSGNPSAVTAQWATSGEITVGRSASGQSNVFISSNGVDLRFGTVARIHLATDGSGYVANNYINWDVSGNANIANWAVNQYSISNGTTYIASNYDVPAGRVAWFGRDTAGAQGVYLKAANEKFIRMAVGVGTNYPFLSVHDATRYRVVIGGLNYAFGLEGATDSMGMKIWNSAGDKIVEFSDDKNNIAGWDITSTGIIKDTGSPSTSAGMSVSDYPFYAGATYANRATAPFRVTPAGVLTARSGTVGGWTLGTSRLSSTNIYLDQASQYISIGNPPPTQYAGGTGIWMGLDTLPKMFVGAFAAGVEINSGNASNITHGTFSGGTFTKDTSGAGWTAGYSSTPSITGDGFITWTENSQTFDYRCVGLSTSDTNQNYTSIQYGLYFNTGSSVYYSESGSQGSVGTRVLSTTTYKIERVDTATTPKIKYYIDGALVRTVSGVTSSPLYLDTALYTNSTNIPPVTLTNVAMSSGFMFDGSTLTVKGTVTATAGAIGGWTLGDNYLIAGSGSSRVGLDSGGTNPAFYAGSETPSSAPFRVSKTGGLTATSVSITAGGGNVTLDTNGLIFNPGQAVANSVLWQDALDGSNFVASQYGFRTGTNSETSLFNVMVRARSSYATGYGQYYLEVGNSSGFSGAVFTLTNYSSSHPTNPNKVAAVFSVATGLIIGNGISTLSIPVSMLDVRGGITVNNPTGADKGAGTINAASTYYANGQAGVTAGSFSTITAITSTAGLVTQLTGSSDARLKDIGGPFTRGLSDLLKINPVRFHWNKFFREHWGQKSNPELFGVTAQNMEYAIPESVGVERWSDDSEWLSVNKDALIMTLVNSVKELSAELTALKATLN